MAIPGPGYPLTTLSAKDKSLTRSLSCGDPRPWLPAHNLVWQQTSPSLAPMLHGPATGLQHSGRRRPAPAPTAGNSGRAWAKRLWV